jgi:hypothetical protein
VSKIQRIGLKVAAWACLLEAVVHLTALFSGPRPPENDTERTLWRLFSEYHFDVMGTQRSLEDFMTGFSATFSLFVFTLGALTLVAVRRLDGAGLRAFTLVCTLTTGIQVAICVRYFFVFPLAFAVVIFAAYLASALAGRSS